MKRSPHPPPPTVTPTSRRRCRHTSPQVRPNRILPSRFSRNQTPGASGIEAPWSEKFHAPPQDSNPGEASAIPVWKRTSDILLVLLILPVVALVASLLYCWIQVVSPGSVLFRQTRIGRGGKPFTIYKFRSMNLSAPTDIHEAHVEHLIKSNKPMTKLDVTGDSRLIRGGCLMRTSGLDELPQFINVLRGEMSLVGPRPCLPNEFALYDPHQRQRFTVQPGLTGLWQVNRTHSTTFSEMVKMDCDYVDHLTAMTDFQIILRTPVALLGQMKACTYPKVKKTGRRRGAIQPTSRPDSLPAYCLSMSNTQRISD